MKMHFFGAILILSIATTAFAQPMPPQRKADLACEQKTIEQLGSAAAARLVDGTRQHEKNQFSACFNVRSSDGAYRLVLVMCNYTAAGDVTGAVQVLDNQLARDGCGRRFSRK